jgi:hypothetical protein
MALALNKILVANTSTNTPSAYLQTVTISSVGAGNATAMSNAKAIPAGMFLYPPTANVTIEVNAYTGTANSWTTLIAANTGGVLFSDGYNVRANATTGSQTVTLYDVNGGQAATQSSYATA